MNDLGFLERLVAGAAVEWRPFGEVAEIYGGLTGKTKKDFQSGTSKFVPYKNIFNNIQLDLENLDSVNVSNSERQNKIKYGDVLFTASSESADEAGISSAVTQHIENNIYLNSFSFGIRFNQDVCLAPEFSKYLFRSAFMRKQIAKTASGVTRFNVSKARFKRLMVPIPCPEDLKKSLAIQMEIVRVLDFFTELTAKLTVKLTSEIEARERQYNHYRDRLLSFEGGDVEWETLSDIGEFIRGKRFTKADYVDDGIDAIHYGEIYTHYGVYAFKTLSQVRNDLATSLRYAEQNDVIIAGVSETIKDVGKAVAWLGDGKVAIHDDSYAFRHSMNAKFIAYVMQTDAFNAQKTKYVSSGKIKRLLIDGIKNVKIPIPYPDDFEKSLAEQARIVNILDRFDTLTASVSKGLAREIALRQQQYEYYRDLLLSFPKPEETA